jgi:hypothetical protein
MKHCCQPSADSAAARLCAASTLALPAEAPVVAALTAEWSPPAAAAAAAAVCLDTNTALSPVMLKSVAAVLN